MTVKGCKIKGVADYAKAEHNMKDCSLKVVEFRRKRADGSVRGAEDKVLRKVSLFRTGVRTPEDWLQISTIFLQISTIFLQISTIFLQVSTIFLQISSTQSHYT